jgi:hypothetical protein
VRLKGLRKLKKKSNDFIRIQTRDLPACNLLNAALENVGTAEQM